MRGGCALVLFPIMIDKAIRRFLLSAAALILASALVRFANLFHGTLTSRMMLAAKDNFFGLQVQDELWMLAAAELIIGGLLLVLPNPVTRLLLVAWAMTNYFAVKIALQMEQINLQSSFIGSLSDPFHLAQGWTGILVSILPFYLLFGAGLALGWLELNHFKSRQKNRVVMQTGRGGYWKISCSACGGHIKFALQNEGQKILCPHCQKALTLRQPNVNLKTSCFFCHGHIEFPAHAIGTKMPCPHCLKDITLMEPK